MTYNSDNQQKDFAFLPKFCGAILSGYLQTIYWDRYGNTTIKYLKKSTNEVYKNLSSKFKKLNKENF